jgi:paraquat-inducible protein B
VSRIVERLAAADVPLLIDSITVMAGALSRAAGNRNTREILGSIETTLKTVDVALGRLTTIADSVAASLGPVKAQFDSTTRAVRGTLDAATNALGDFDPAAIAESPAMIRTEEAMLELTRAARAFRELAQAIERNPSILLRGRDGGVR